jgi:hypothetical protein
MSGKATGLGKANTDEFGPLNCDHGKGRTPLHVKEDVAHGQRDCGEGSGSGRRKGNQISKRSNHHGALDGKTYRTA